MLKHEYTSSDQETNETIVLLHGFGGNHRVWKHQIPLLRKKYNVLAIDLPSHNDGNLKLSDMQVTLEAITQKILAVCDEYGIKHAMFMGVSLGTIFVKYIEAYYPEYVEFGVLVGAVASVNIFLGQLVKIFSAIGDKLPFSLIYYIFSWVLMPFKGSKKSREVFRKCAVALNEKEFKLWMRIFDQAFAFNKRFKRREFTKNAYITGIHDLCFINGAKSESGATNGRFIVLRDCGHVCNIDKRETFNRLMLALLNNKGRS